MAAADRRHPRRRSLHRSVSCVLVMIGIFSEAAQRRIRDAMPVIPSDTARVSRMCWCPLPEGWSAAAERLLYRCRFWLQCRGMAVIVAATWCLLGRFLRRRHFPIVDSAVFTGFVAFGSIVQIPGIGGGMQVASVVILTELFGVDLRLSDRGCRLDLAYHVRVCGADRSACSPSTKDLSGKNSVT